MLRSFWMQNPAMLDRCTLLSNWLPGGLVPSEMDEKIKPKKKKKRALRQEEQLCQNVWVFRGDCYVM